MAYPGEFLKLTFSGTVAQQDIWSNAFTLLNETVDDAAAAFAALNPADLLTAATDFYRGANSGMANYNWLTQIKLAHIGTDGKTIGEPKVFDLTSPVLGSYQGSVIPQASIVVSLETDVPRGLASKGRFFPPSGFADVQTNSATLSTASTEAIANRAVAFINAINTWGDLGANSVAVAINSSARTGANHYVTGVRVGNVTDIQRRRRNRIAETYVERPLVTP